MYKQFSFARVEMRECCILFFSSACKVLPLLSPALLFLSLSLICTDEQGALELENKQILISKLPQRVKNTLHREVHYVISTMYVR